MTALPHLTKKQQKAVFLHMTDDQVRTVCELAANVLAKNINLSEGDKETLNRRKGVIRKLAARGATPSRRYSIINKNIATVVQLVEIALKRLKSKI